MFHRARTLIRPVRPPRLTLCETLSGGWAPLSLNTAMRVLPTKYSQVLVRCLPVSRHWKVTLLPADVAGQPLDSSLSTAKRLPPPLHCIEPLGASTLCGS